MSAPLLDHGPDGPRLEVRLAGRMTSHVIRPGEFVIGSGLGCDLRIPGQQVPAAFCTIVRGSDDSLSLHPLSETHPIFVNGSIVRADQVLALKDVDRLIIGPADVTVRTGSVSIPAPRVEAERVDLHPTFIPESRAAAPTITPTPTVPLNGGPAVRPDLEALHAQLLARSRELDERAKDLEEDRVLWYRRRQELEAELVRLREAAPAAEWRQREAELATKELDLARVREELAVLRQSLYDQFRERRDQIGELQDDLRAKQAATAERERLVGERERLAEARWVEADALKASAAGIEPRLAEIAKREGQIEAALAEIERQRHAATSLREELARDREAFDRDRNLHESQWSEQDRSLTSRDTELRRREDELRRGFETLAAERAKAVHAVSIYDGRFAELDERGRSLERRAAEIDNRHAQLAADAAELEDQVRLIDDERHRIAAETDRLAKQMDDLRRREQSLAEKAIALDAQQAAMLVLRSSLDRREAALQSQEAEATHVRYAIATSHSEIVQRLGEADTLRAELGQFKDDADARRRLLDDREIRIEAEWTDLRSQQAELAREAERLAVRDAELDGRTSDLAEQAAVLKARIAQIGELHERMESDRAAVRERERMLNESDGARLALQDQLRKRSEELQQRAKWLDGQVAALAEERASFDERLQSFVGERTTFESLVAARENELQEAKSTFERQSQGLMQREESLARQVARLREVGQSVAAERKSLFEARQEWERRRAAESAEADQRTRLLSLHHQELNDRTAELVRRLPELEQKSLAAIAQLAAARDVLRGQLDELHAFAGQGRESLESVRQQLQAESERLTDRERALDMGRVEHRKAVSEFRQQLVQWQSQIGELRQSLLLGESNFGDRRAEMEAIRREADEKAKSLAKQERELHDARRLVDERRGELDRHLNDMREWYKKKLRELANGSIHLHRNQPEQTDLTPGDQHLGDLLRSRDLVDPRTLQTLWAEAARQRRTLRQVLLSSGTLTLYQLALIEAGNLDALVVGRFRVIDRVPSSNREIVLKVFDPERAGEPGAGIVLLRMLADSELHDAVHPDEFRQRFATLAGLHHPNLANTLDVIDVSGRPAAIQEWVGGIASHEWPSLSTGVWLKMLTDTVGALATLHRAGIPHGRMVAESIALTPVGLVKLAHGGLPHWLDNSTEPGGDPFDSDLRRLGEIATEWAGRTPVDGRKGRKPKPLPDPLQAMLRRLAASAAFPMADEVARAEPYPDADHLLVDLHRLGQAYPCPPGEWGAVLDFVGETVKGTMPTRKAA